MTPRHQHPRRPTLRQVRLWAGVAIGAYVTLHLLNHALGMISVNAQEAARPWVMWFWSSPPGQVLLYGSVAVHAALGLAALARRRHLRAPPWELAQIALGLAIPYLLLVHVVNTRGTRVLTRIDIDYVYEIANLWVDPWVRFRQVLLVLLVWGHFAVGLHFWLRRHAWYPRAFPAMLLGYVVVPAAALVGFAEVGMTMTARAAADPAWYKEISTRGKPRDPAAAQLRADLKAWAPTAWLGLVGVVAAAAAGRNLLGRRKRFAVAYPGEPAVRAPIGMSILEVSRMIGRPHMSVCGGRARCTTCRVRVACGGGDDQLPSPNEDEARALGRIEAPAGVRLACQLRPAVDVDVVPLLRPLLRHPRDVRRQSAEFGREQDVTVLFIDLRGSTKLAETRLPFDVVFLMNQFLEQMAEAIERAGGLYSNFTGDGLMALFGLNASHAAAARSAVNCAADMVRRLRQLNARFADELRAPIEMGIGIHTGVAVVGRMGPPKAPFITALGDTVNTAARLEGATKDAGAALVVSSATLEAASLDAFVTFRQLSLRGREGLIAVAALSCEQLEELVNGRAGRSPDGARPFEDVGAPPAGGWGSGSGE